MNYQDSNSLDGWIIAQSPAYGVFSLLSVTANDAVYLIAIPAKPVPAKLDVGIKTLCVEKFGVLQNDALNV